MSDDIVERLYCSYADPPCESCTFCAARAEIERLREQVAELLPWFEDIVIGERIRERAANDNGHRTSLGEVAADFGIDLTLDEIERLRAAGDALATNYQLLLEDHWSAFSAALLSEWQEARRG